jgi:hypothetical protein
MGCGFCNRVRKMIGFSQRPIPSTTATIRGTCDLGEGQSGLGPIGTPGGDPRDHAPGPEQPRARGGRADPQSHHDVDRRRRRALFAARVGSLCRSRPSANDFAGWSRHQALDLASKTDLASLAIVFPPARRSAGHTSSDESI